MWIRWRPCARSKPLGTQRHEGTKKGEYPRFSYNDSRNFSDSGKHLRMENKKRPGGVADEDTRQQTRNNTHQPLLRVLLRTSRHWRTPYRATRQNLPLRLLSER